MCHKSPPWINKIKKINLTDLSQLVADPSVKLFAFNAQEVIPRLQDATFDGNGSCSIDVVSGHHADSDASPLTLSDGFWYLMRATGEITIHAGICALFSKRIACFDGKELKLMSVV